MPVYPMDIAGLHRELPICKVTDDLYIGAIALPIAIVVALVLYFLCCKLFVKKAA